MKTRSDPTHCADPQRILSPQDRAWLELQYAFGVDAAVAECPHDYLTTIVQPPATLEPQRTSPQETQASEPTALPPASTPSMTAKKAQRPQNAPVAPDRSPPKRHAVPLGRARAEAVERAAAAQTLTELEESVATFEGCALKATASQLVFGAGVVNPAVMIIGEGPGSDEDRRGKPFVGASGRLMLRALEIIGLRRTENLYITNAVYWRPPADRTPNDTEVATCLQFLCRQISLVQPKLILLVGARAAQSMLGTTSGITRIRGSWSSLAPGLIETDIPVLAMFHPAYLFRNHAQKRLFWYDILSLRAQIDALALNVPWPESGLQGFAEDWKP